jgi:hypothetical protein
LDHDTEERNMKMIRIPFALMAYSFLMTAFPNTGRTAEIMPGGYFEASVTNARVVEAANFAIKAEQNAMQERKDAQPASLVLVEILGAQQQVVAGTNFRLKLTVRVNEAERVAEVVVYRKLSGEYKLTSWTWK